MEGLDKRELQQQRLYQQKVQQMQQQQIQRGAQQQQRQKRQVSLYSIMRRFYAEELVQIMKSFKRGQALSCFLMMLKGFFQILLMLNPTVMDKLVAIEFYFDTFKTYNPQSFLKNHTMLCDILVYFFTFLNAFLFLYLGVKTLIYVARAESNKQNQRLSNFISGRERVGIRLRFEADEHIISFIVQIYCYSFSIPSIVVAVVALNNASIINLVLTFLLCMLIVNNDFDYLLSSEDFLRSKYVDIQMIICFIEKMSYIVMYFLDGSETMILLTAVNIMEFARLIFYQPFLVRSIQQLALTVQLFVGLFSSICYVFAKLSNSNSNILSVILIVILPFSYKTCESIEIYLKRRNQQILSKRLNDNEKVGAEVLNYFMRTLVGPGSTANSNNSHEEIENLGYLLKRKENIEISEIQSLQAQFIAKQHTYSRKDQSSYIEKGVFEKSYTVDKQMKDFALNFSKSPQQYQQQMQLKQQQQKNRLDQQQLMWTQQLFKYEEEHKDQLKGEWAPEEVTVGKKEFIAKENVFGINDSMQKALRNFVKELFEKERSARNFSVTDVYYLVFVAEVLQNYQLFELLTTRIPKGLPIKQLQILASLTREVDKRKEVLRVTNDQTQLFDISYYEALVYDELALQTAQLLEEAIIKKIHLLCFLKQRHIDLTALQIQLNNLFNLRTDLIKNISLMIKVNEFSHKLYDIYLDYLEALSFSESDIKLDRKNRYAKKQRTLYFQLNSSDACVIFTSLRGDKDMMITKISNNAPMFFGYKTEQIISQPLEKILPEPYAKFHRGYVEKFFLRGETITDLKSRLLFATQSTGHIFPVSVDVKVNMFAVEREFGLTACIVRANRSTQYVLFDCYTSRLVSMTAELHAFVFPVLKTFSRVNMAAYFPFISNFKLRGYGETSSAKFSLNSVNTRGGAEPSAHSNVSNEFHNNFNYQNNEGDFNGEGSQSNMQKTGNFQDQISKKKDVFEDKEGSVKYVSPINTKKREQFMNKTFLFTKKIDSVKEMVKSNNQNLEDKKDYVKPQQRQQSFNPVSPQDNILQDKEEERIQAAIKQSRQVKDSLNEDDERKYRDLQFLMVVNLGSSQQSLQSTKQSRRVQSLKDFSFFTMNVGVFSLDSAGLERIKFIEITNIKQINPIHNARLIISVYREEIEDYSTNMSSMRISDIQCLLSELEIHSLKDSNRNSIKIKQDLNKSNEFIEGDLLESNMIHDSDAIELKNYQVPVKYQDDKQVNSYDNRIKNIQKNSIDISANKAQDNQFATGKIFNKDNQQGLEYEGAIQIVDPYLQREGDVESSQQTNMEGHIDRKFQEEDSQVGNQNAKSYMFLYSNQFNNQNNQSDSALAVNTTEKKLISTQNFQNISAVDINDNSHLAEDKKRRTTLIKSEQSTDVNQQSYVKTNSKGIGKMAFFPPDMLPMTPAELEPSSSNISAFPLFAQLNNSTKNNQIGGFEAWNQDSTQNQKAKLEASQFMSPKPGAVAVTSSRNHLVVKSSSFLSPQNDQPSGQLIQGIRAQQQFLGKVIGPANITLLKNQDDYEGNQKRNPAESGSKIGQVSSLTPNTLSKKRNDLAAAQDRQQEGRNIREVLDQTSSHSRESSSSSSKKTTKIIILKKTTLGIMKAINFIGLLSFLAIIIVVVQQYLQMNSQFETFNSDLKLVNWATSYEINLYVIKKNYNLKNMLTNGDLSVSAALAVTWAEEAKDNMIKANDDMTQTLLEITQASDTRQMVQRMLDAPFKFRYGAVIDYNQPIVGQLSLNFYNLVEVDQTLYTGALNLFPYLFRYTRQIGTPTSRFVAVNNTDTIVTSLHTVSEQCQTSSLEQLSSISTSLNNLLIIICLVTAGCVYVIIPVFSFVQLKKEQIIQLFATFNSTFLETAINDISKILAKISSTKLSNMMFSGGENQKRQNLSSTSRIPRFSRQILFATIFVYLITLPYPLLNKVLSNEYTTQSQEIMPLLSAMFLMEADILRVSSMVFYCLSLRYGSDTDSIYTFEDFSSSLDEIVADATKAFQNLQDEIQLISQVSMYDSDVFKNYFLASLEGDICEIQFNYLEYLNTNYTITQSACKLTHSGTLAKGLQISIKSILEAYHQIYEILNISDLATFKAQFVVFQSNIVIKDFLNFEVYLIEIIDGLTTYLRDQDVSHKNYLQTLLLVLLFYQFFVMTCIFYFGWVVFYRSMDDQLYKAKLSLVVLNVNYLVSNPYVQNYLHNNLT